MDSSLDRLSESLNLLQPLKIDERLNIGAGVVTIGTCDNLAQFQGSGLGHTVKNAIDNWAGKQVIDYTAVANTNRNYTSPTVAAISIVKPQSAKLQIAAAVVKALPLAVVKPPANLAPQSLTVTGIKSSYELNSKLSIDSGLVSDNNGWQDISKVDFWLTDAQGKRVELADASTFTSKDATSAKFAYSTNLTGIAAGNYKLNAIAFDKAGSKSNQFSQSIAIKPPANLAPQALAITGIKSSYELNSKLSIDSGLVSDNNGWQDISKVDFWLTDAQGKRVELADASTFTSKDATSAKFAYSTNLTGIAAGNYQLNAVAFDKAGSGSNKFSQSITIKPVNIAPKSLAITGVKSKYSVNSTLSIDSGLVSDSNGWQDISKVDFWLTDAQGKRVELADVSTFSSKDATSAKFAYSNSLSGIAAGEYKLNATAYDKANLASNLVTQLLVIEPIVIKPVVVTPAINPPVKSAIDIKISYPSNAFLAQQNQVPFSDKQKQAFEIAASNWERIITRDKDVSGIFNIVAISSTKDFNGDSYFGTSTGAEAFVDPAINSRTNISNDQVPKASPIDIDGVDYDNRINVNSYYLQSNPSLDDLVVTIMHEIGHALGLEHEDGDSLMGAVHLQDKRSVLNSNSFAGLEKLGYKVDRNAPIKWA